MVFKKNKNFSNNSVKKRIRRTLLDFFKWKIGYCSKDILIEPIKNFKYPLSIDSIDSSKPSVLWVGHCSFIINMDSKIILTDPIWSDFCSPVQFIGPKRKTAPAFEFNKLKHVDYVLISHNHYDHLDHKTVLKLFKKFPNILWIVPSGLKKWFLKRKIKNVIELSWWEKYNDDSINVSSVPAQHYSGRGLFDSNKTLWCGYVFEGLKAKKKVYFTGDTGYNMTHFKAIGKAFKSIDLSLIPIGAYTPREIMSPVHIDPNEAVKIHKEVNSKMSVAMHFKTFNLSDEKPHHAAYELFLNLQKESIDHNKFLVIDIGDHVNF